jgi:hypothetical protein
MKFRIFITLLSSVYLFYLSAQIFDSSRKEAVAILAIALFLVTDFSSRFKKIIKK